MEENKKSAIDRILLLTQQDPEFNDELRKRLGMFSSTTSNNVGSVSDNDKIDQIYELCVEEILHQQAENYYEPFNFFSEKTQLVDDYVNMEHARRKNKFDYYSLALYEQIERILNKIFDDSDFLPKINEIWDITGSIAETKKEKKKYINTFGNIIWGNDKNENEKYLTDGKKRAKNKSKLSARDKIRIVLFFFKYYADPNYDPQNFFYGDYDELCKSYLNIYSCRNEIHRGIEQSEKEINKLKEIHKKESSYYFEFNWLLTQFVWLTKDYHNTIEIILAKLPKKTEAIVTQIYGSSAFVKLDEETQAKQVPDFLFTKIKGHKINDSIHVVTIGSSIVDIC